MQCITAHHRQLLCFFYCDPIFVFSGLGFKDYGTKQATTTKSSAALGLRNTLDLVEADIAMVDNKFIIGEGRESSTCERNNRTVGQLAAWGTRDLVPAFPDVLEAT